MRHFHHHIEAQRMGQIIGSLIAVERNLTGWILSSADAYLVLFTTYRLSKVHIRYI